ncbi:alpha/beta fold hydrolase [Bacillus horti]|uniref:Pimeloyl-ACP methyl ester carboxylesterase n=1 Tax=Caldalkalibacillus horti TaxID=77523 RepID=A0ABT9W0D0_9BACI|nr:alpha/beta hydrolase [Bacillus horti]MDQ0166720.1 pimeloyl-ACP methyl ester carboxylesterase [Bacillus horti]
MGHKKRLRLDNGETIAYQEKGHGDKVIIFIHGNMCSSDHFSSLLGGINQEKYTCYALDLRGFGDSTYHTPIESVSDLAKDVYAFINKMQLNKVSLVGWSAGGPVCLQLCVDHPNVVKEIILLSSVGLKGDPLLRKNKNGEITEGYYTSKEEMALDPEVFIPAQAIQKNDFQTISSMWNVGIYTNQKPSPTKNETLVNETLKQRNLVDVYWALAHFNLSMEHNGYIHGNGYIKQIVVPVLSFWGEQDPIVKLKAVQDTVHFLPNASLRILKECGHCPLIDSPDEIIKGMEEIIS